MRKKYPAKSFLRRFPNLAVRNAVMAAYPDVDFSKGSRDYLDADALEELEVHWEEPSSLSGLEVFRRLKRFKLTEPWTNWECPELTRAWSFHLPDSWRLLEEMTLLNCSAVSVVYPEQMLALRQLLRGQLYSD